jgi:peptide deformylase
MTAKDIITLPNPLLHQRSQRIGHIDHDAEQLAQDMISATLDWEDGREHEIGAALAAIQIAKPYRIIVIRNDFDNRADRSFSIFINPEIVKVDGQPTEELEGCLSVQDVYGEVARYPKVKVKALNLHGQPVRITATDFLARVFQHEIDHTNGIVFIDRITNPRKLFRLQADGHFAPLHPTESASNS